MTAGDDLTVQGAATLNAKFGSHVVANDVFVVGGSQVIVDGSGSLLTANASAAVGDLLGGANTITCRNGAACSVGGTFNVGVSANAATTGTLNIESATDAGLYYLNVGTGAAGAGTVNLDGTGSTLSVNASFGTITVGTASGGVGTLNIGTSTGGATLDTLGGVLITINPTGALNIGSNTTSGTLNANGNILIDGGRLTVRGTNSTLNTSTNSFNPTIMTVQNGGLVDIPFYATGSIGATYNVTGVGSRWVGQTLTVGRHGNFDVAMGGQLSVNQLSLLSTDGSASFVADGAATTVMASTGTINAGTATFRNNASGTFPSGITLASIGIASTLRVESGAHLVSNGIQLTGLTSLYVTGAGSTVTLTPGSGLTIVGGQFSSGDTAFFDVDDNAQVTVSANDTTTTDNATQFRVRNGATFTSGNFVLNGLIVTANGGVIHIGTLTLNPTGTFFIDSPAAVVVDHLIFNGGTGSANDGFPPLDITVNQKVTLQNGAQFSFASGFATKNLIYTVTGAGAKLETTNSSSLMIGNGASMNVASGGLLSAKGNLEVGNGTIAVLAIDGSGSIATTQSGTGLMIVGHATVGTGTVNIGTTTGGGTLITGSGGLMVNATGTVNVGAGTNTGTLNANGNVTVNGGTLTHGAYGAFNLAEGRTMEWCVVLT